MPVRITNRLVSCIAGLSTQMGVHLGIFSRGDPLLKMTQVKAGVLPLLAMTYSLSIKNFDYA